MRMLLGFLLSFVLCGLCFAVHGRVDPWPSPLSLAAMTARATDLTGRLMACFGEPGAAQCRPVELVQTGHPEVIVRPVVVCIDGGCHLTPEALR